MTPEALVIALAMLISAASCVLVVLTMRRDRERRRDQEAHDREANQ